MIWGPKAQRSRNPEAPSVWRRRVNGRRRITGDPRAATGAIAAFATAVAVQYADDGTVSKTVCLSAERVELPAEHHQAYRCAVAQGAGHEHASIECHAHLCHGYAFFSIPICTASVKCYRSGTDGRDERSAFGNEGAVECCAPSQRSAKQGGSAEPNHAIQPRPC